jgi:flagellar biogenesis protein FliO
MRSEKFIADEKWTIFGVLGLIVLAVAFVIGLIWMI